MRKKILPVLILFILVVGLGTTPGFSCAVCFGGADSNLIRGFTWGIWILLLLPFVLMGTIGSMIFFSIRRKKRHV